MTHNLDSEAIKRISIIDDDAGVRDVYQLPIEEMGLEPVMETGPLGQLQQCIEVVRGKADAAICDHHLKVKAYSIFNGAELVAGFYKAGFPAVLCTKWFKASIDEMRPYRRYIPSLIDPKNLDPLTLKRGIESCLKEFNGEFLTVRRPWRTQIRVEDISPSAHGGLSIYVVVPGWNSNEVVALPQDAFPADLVTKLTPGSRLHAKVNLGADRSEDLFFEEWDK